METYRQLPRHCGGVTMVTGNMFRVIYMLGTLVTVLLPTPLGLVTMTLTLGSGSGGQQGPDTAHDPRMTTYEDVLSDSNIAIYQHNSIIDYSHLVIDIPRQQLIVGARNHLLRLNMSNLQEVEVVEWPVDKLTARICQAKGQSTDDCQNYVRVLEKLDDRILACGTYAFSPKCSWRQATALLDVISYMPGMARCPYDPHQNNTALLTSDGNLYSATVTDFTARDPAVFRSLGPAKHLRTVQYNSRWLNEPHFVSSHEIGDFIYFFFRESAVEYINCGKNIYSRVARVCKNDAGGSNFLLEDNWTSFVKARLNCSLPGTHPFYFNEIQDTYFVENNELLYAIFTTSPTSIYGTAVCVFNMSSFHQAFSGSFKYQENTQMVWTRVTNSGAHQCDQSASSRLSSPANQTPGQRKLVDATKFQIMDSAVHPIHVEPMLIAENERFSHLVVDTVSTKHHREYNVVFVVTLEGTIKKYIQLPTIHSLCLIEHIQVVPPGSSPGLVKTMKLAKEEGSLYVGTDSKVYKIPLQRCHKYLSKKFVSEVLDDAEYVADTFEVIRRGYHRLTVTFNTKPVTLASTVSVLGPRTHIVAGTARRRYVQRYHPPYHPMPGIRIYQPAPLSKYRGWSEWSDWEVCEQGDVSTPASSLCMCRHRTCHGATSEQKCTGTNVQVSNCTVHGGWTAWSSWSSCSSSCGIAVRARHRYCGNPEPQFNGRICIGPDRDETYCLDNPDCPETRIPPVDGQWSAWSGWSMCTRQCGGGIRTKDRACSSPLPQHGGIQCVGNNIDWQECNTEECDERRRTEWTDWQTVNATKDGATQERIRMTCRAPVEDENDIRISHIKRDSRFCPAGADDDDCKKRGPDPVEPVWSPWSLWTTCSRLCGGGSQSRRRLCMPSGSSCGCDGHGRELRICNTHICQGEWSCWSDYSACSATCGAGRRWRKRQCQAGTPGGHYTQPCPGSDREDKPCHGMPACEDCSKSNGWAEWSKWSTCGPQNTRQRRRLCCDRATLYRRCEGPGQETRMCKYNEIPQIGLQAAAQGDSSTDIKINVETAAVQEAAVQGTAVRLSCRECFCMYHLIIVGIVGFILGGVICVGIFLYCQRQQQENKEQDKYNTLQRLHQSDSFKNEYVTPTEVNPPNQSSMDLIPLGTNSQYYSSGSLKHKESYRSLTVREASQKRNSLMRTNSMRTNLSLNNIEY